MAFARDFAGAHDDVAFLDGVLLQEMVHYDDVSFLPDPMRCYESNMEIRGHYAMILYWKDLPPGSETAHPRIRLAITAGLTATSSRSAWYRYLNQVERTDFRVQDRLVSLEYHTLPALSSERTEDQRFLGQLSEIVSGALARAANLRRNVARLPSDSINADARVISAVASLVPRVMLRYEHMRSDLREPDGGTRGQTMTTQISAIRLSLDALSSLMGILASDPDFQRKSDFAGSM
jgi:hypothetical protein